MRTVRSALFREAAAAAGLFAFARLFPIHGHRYGVMPYDGRVPYLTEEHDRPLGRGVQARRSRVQQDLAGFDDAVAVQAGEGETVGVDVEMDGGLLAGVEVDLGEREE
jgi:hypothetical protein